MRGWGILAIAALAGGCAGGEAIRTSQNTMVIQAGAAPACGPQGALRVAQRVAAIETLRAGFDRYVIAGGQSQNNVSVFQGPGTANTTISGFGGIYTAQTTFTPGPTIVAGSHDQALNVVMFRANEPGAAMAVDARTTLGPQWQDAVKNGVNTCL